MQLGKALQDPTKGLSALGRAGVTFTDEQKKMIAGMQESGDLLGAQKVVLKAVETQVGGTAAATATGADKMNVAFGQTQEAVGNALLPILEKLLPILTELAGFIEKNVNWLLPLAVVIGVLAVAYNIASVAATLFGVSTLAALGPVLLVIAGIAALIAIGLLIVKNWDTIKSAAAAVWSAMQAAWDSILGVVRTAFNWIRDNWPLLLAILTGPIGAAVLLVVRNFDTIKDTFKGVFDFITGLIDSLVGWFEKLPGRILTALGNVGDKIKDIFKTAINWFIDKWNNFKIPGVSVLGHNVTPDINFPDIPRLAKGGIVTSPTLALIGERGPEAVVPLGAAVGNTFTINVAVAAGGDPVQTGKAIVDAIQSYERANGARWRAAS
jgi:phage-related minor tail protein